jgi:hypothetical protein
MTWSLPLRLLAGGYTFIGSLVLRMQHRLPWNRLRLALQ